MTFFNPNRPSGFTPNNSLMQQVSPFNQALQTASMQNPIKEHVMQNRAQIEQSFIPSFVGDISSAEAAALDTSNGPTKAITEWPVTFGQPTLQALV